MPSKSRKCSSAEFDAFEAKRDIGAGILQSITEMKTGKGKIVVSSATEASKATGLSRSRFACLLGMSVRTLQGQGWERGRKHPNGGACTLLAIARTNPKAVLAVSAQEPPQPVRSNPSLKRSANGRPHITNDICTDPMKPVLPRHYPMHAAGITP